MEPYEFFTTVYSHPEQTSGQHTNGHANIFVRMAGEKQWYKVNGFSLAAARRNLSLLGWDQFIWHWCTPVGG